MVTIVVTLDNDKTIVLESEENKHIPELVVSEMIKRNISTFRIKEILVDEVGHGISG